MKWTVLVVEDNRALADTLAVALSLLPDTDVLVAYDGQDGFGMLGRADALCTDLDLPRMNGEALIVNFRRMKPGAPVIAMSAGPGEKAGADLFFPKPYSTAAVREALKEMLYA